MNKPISGIFFAGFFKYSNAGGLFSGHFSGTWASYRPPKNGQGQIAHPPSSRLRRDKSVESSKRSCRRHNRTVARHGVSGCVPKIIRPERTAENSEQFRCPVRTNILVWRDQTLRVWLLSIVAPRHLPFGVRCSLLDVRCSPPFSHFNILCALRVRFNDSTLQRFPVHRSFRRCFSGVRSEGGSLSAKDGSRSSALPAPLQRSCRAVARRRRACPA